MADPLVTAAAEALWPRLPGEVQDGYELDDTHAWAAAAAAAALRVMADEIDRGPTFAVPPSVISALVRERADALEPAAPPLNFLSGFHAASDCQWVDDCPQHREPSGPELKATPPTPELDRQSAAIKNGAHRVGEFLDWLDENGYTVARRNEDDYGEVHLVPDATPNRDLVAGFFKIDMDKIEAERKSLLEHLRECQS